MATRREQIIRLSYLSLVTVLIASCSNSKIAQCSKLTTVANQAVEDLQAVKAATAGSNVNDAAQSEELVNEVLKIADAADSANANMQALELTDQGLKDFQQRFITMYTDISKSTRSLATAVGQKNYQTAQQAFNSIKTATAQEESLAQEVNTYCDPDVPSN
jgi:uncharacterized protein Yka (UPF0111/DUF47 family)